MRGDDLRVFREERNLNQGDFAAWLNERLGRRYDKQKVSRWETGAERIPQRIADLLSGRVEPERSTGPALVLAVANQEGGVGKAGTAGNVADGLPAEGSAGLLGQA